MMTAWLRDPLVRLAARQSSGWTRGVLLAPFVGIALFDQPHPAELSGRVAAFALCFGWFQAAATLLETERDGRFDHLRLSGRAPGVLAGALLTGASGPWIAAGVVLLALWTVWAGATARALAIVMAFAGSAAALAALTVAARASRSVDPRLQVAGLGVVSMFTGTIAGAWVGEPGGPVGIPTTIFAGNALIIAMAAPRIRRRLARPPIERDIRPARWRMRHSALLMRWPNLVRGLALGASGIEALPALVLLVLFAWWTAPEGPGAPMSLPVRLASVLVGSYALVYLVLFAGFLAVALICKEDAETGRLNLIRQSSSRPFATAFEILIGLWMPFALVAAATAILIGALWQTLTPQGLAVAAALALAAPLPLLEGWHRLWPLSYTAPLVFGALLPGLVDRWWPAAVVPIAAWAALAKTIRQPERPSLPAAGAMLIVAALTALAMWPVARISAGLWQADAVLGGVGLAVILIGLGPFLIDPRSSRAVDRWGQPLAIAAVVVAAASASRIGAANVALMGLSPLAGWWVAYRIEGGDSLNPMARAGIRLASGVALLYGLNRIGGAQPAAGALAIAVVSLAVIAELLCHIAGFLQRRRQRVGGAA